MGHVYRCLRLARELSKKQVKIVFFIRDNPTVQLLIEAEGFTAATFGPTSSVAALDQETCRYAELECGILYIDLRGDKRRLVDLARSKGLFVVVYDDVYEPGLFPHLLINPSECDTQKYKGDEVEYLLGSQYIILDPSLIKFRKLSFSAHIRSIFVCFGGADPCNVTARVVNLLIKSGFTGQISVALGLSYRNTAEIKMLTKDAGSVLIHEGVSFLAPVMTDADAVITSGATLMCEAIALALPVLALPTIPHEVAIAESYKSEGLVDSISCDVNDMDDGVLGSVIYKFMESIAGRAALFRAQAAELRFIGSVAISARLVQILEKPCS